MNGFANNHLADALANARRRETDRRADEGRLLPATVASHPVRTRFAHTLIRAGLALAPQNLEVTPAPRTSQPC